MSQPIASAAVAVQADAATSRANASEEQTGVGSVVAGVPGTRLTTGLETYGGAVLLAVAATREIEDDKTRALAWERLVPVLEGEARSDAIGAALAAAAAGQSGQAIAELELYLSGARRQLALQIAYLLSVDVERLIAVSSFIDRAAVADRVQRIEYCVALARIVPEWQLPDAVGRLAAHLDEAQLTELLSLDQIIECLERRPNLAQRLSEALRERLLDRIQDRPKLTLRTPALASLLPLLPPERRDEIISVCLEQLSSVGDRVELATAIADLLPFVPAERADGVLAWGLASAALSEHSNLRDSYTRANEATARSRALVRLARYLTADKDLLPIVVSAVSQVEDEDEKASALRSIAPFLTERLLGEALTMAGLLQEPAARAMAIAALALWLPRPVSDGQADDTTTGPAPAGLTTEAHLSEELRTASVAATALERYRKSAAELAENYKELSFTQALSVSPRLPFVLLSGALGAFAARSLALSRMALVATAWADDRPFVPPLGLSQGVYTPMVVLLFLCLVGGLCAAAYAGFVRKPKDQKAATVVLHLLSFLAGTFLGSKA